MSLADIWKNYNKNFPPLWGESWYFWCSRWDLNPHTRRHTHLKRTCLPFHHPSKLKKYIQLWKIANREKRIIIIIMQKNVIHYVNYSFTKLFSKQFWNIIGSSLIISFAMILVSVLVIIGYGYSLHGFAIENPAFDRSWLSIILSGCTILVILSTLIVLVHGWLAIVIPIRSIDPTEKMDFWSDYILFKTHIGTYFWYILWYSIALSLIVFSYPLLLILLSTLHSILGWIYGVVGVIGILYMMTRLYLSWYHMLSEGSGTVHTFQESIKLSKGRIWKIFWKVFAFSLIIWLISSLIESCMSGLFSIIWSTHIMNEVAQSINQNKNDLLQMLAQISAILKENSWSVSLIAFVFGIFYSVSSVVSRGLYHIFYVRYYLDIREEHENESSFIKSILYGSSHSQNP